MRKNEITLQEMFSTIVEELRESGRWGTAHIYQASSNAFSAFTNYQALPLRKLSPTVLKRFENHLRQRNCSWNTVSTYIKTIRSTYNRAVDMKCVRYTPRLFEHVYTGTRADRKKALETSDISYLVRETEMGMQEKSFPNNLQKTRIFFVLMFMLRGIPFVDLAYLHKRDLQGNTLSYRRRKTGRALTVALTPEAMQMIRLVASRNQDSPYLFPILHSEEGTEAAYREFEQLTPLEQLFHSHFRAAEEDEEGQWMMPMQILSALQTKTRDRLAINKVAVFGRTLKKLEIPNKKSRQGTLYHVMPLD